MVERLIWMLVVVAVLAVTFLISNKLPIKFWEKAFSYSSGALFGTAVLGSIVDWIITGDIMFIVGKVYPVVFVPWILSAVMYSYKNWIAIKEMKEGQDAA